MRRLWSLFAVLGLLAFSVGRAPMSVVAQSAATPITSAQPPLFSVPGVSAPILASGQVDSLTNPDRLRLERLTLPAGATTAHATAGPELVAVESGAVTITDSLGFSATLEAGEGTMVKASSTYQLANSTTADSRVLRLSVASGHDTAAMASPVAGTPVASPVATSPVAVSVLLDQRVTDFPSGSVQLFLAIGTWQPGASSGQVEHSGPIGIVVETGTLTISSPTGIKGQFEAGKGAVLPASTPLEATNSATQPATAILVGVSNAYGSLVNATAPTPTPSPVPTETPVPTNTPTPAPTATEAPSPTLQPTANLNTQPGTYLANHDTWITPDAALRVDVSTGCCTTAEVDLTYINTSNRDVTIIAPLSLVKLSNASTIDGPPEEVYQNVTEITDTSVTLKPGEQKTFTLKYSKAGPPGAYLIVSVPKFGDITGAEWRFKS